VQTLEFWETYENYELINSLFEANKKVKAYLNPTTVVEDTLKQDSAAVNC
jgi:hypothetical protein